MGRHGGEQACTACLLQRIEGLRLKCCLSEHVYLSKPYPASAVRPVTGLQVLVFNLIEAARGIL